MLRLPSNRTGASSRWCSRRHWRGHRSCDTAEEVAEVNHEQAEATKGPEPRELRSPAAFQQQSPGQKPHGDGAGLWEERCAKALRSQGCQSPAEGTRTAAPVGQTGAGGPCAHPGRLRSARRSRAEAPAPLETSRILSSPRWMGRCRAPLQAGCSLWRI